MNSGGGRGLMLLETYHGTYPDEARVDRELDCLKEYYRALGEMVPSAPARTLPLFGGFLTLGILIAVMQYALKKSAKKAEAKAEEKKEVEE